MDMAIGVFKIEDSKQEKASPDQGSGWIGLSGWSLVVDPDAIDKANTSIGTPVDQLSVPEDQANVVSQVRRFKSTIRQLFPDKSRHSVIIAFLGKIRTYLVLKIDSKDESPLRRPKNMFAKQVAWYDLELRDIAKQGVVGDRAQPVYALSQIEILETSFAKEIGNLVQRKFLNRMLLMAVGLSVLILSLSLGIDQLSQILDDDGGLIENYRFTWIEYFAGIAALFDGDHHWLGVGAVLMASSFGAWLSYAVRRKGVEFQDLSEWSYSWSECFLRLAAVILLSLLFMAMINHGVVNLNFGDIKHDEILDSLSASVALGLVFGLSERTLPSNVIARTNSLIPKQKP
jgi:hypothetical protein